MRSQALAVLLLAACAKDAIPTAQPLPTTGETGLPVVLEKKDMTQVDGRRVALEGTVVTAVTEGGDEGTAIELADGTRIFVAFGAPPHGWDWLLGTMVRVEGTLRIEPGGGIEVPILDQADAPLPAGIGMPSAEELLQ